jgi:hypothetical protein
MWINLPGRSIRPICRGQAIKGAVISGCGPGIYPRAGVEKLRIDWEEKEAFLTSSTFGER